MHFEMIRSALKRHYFQEKLWVIAIKFPIVRVQVDLILVEAIVMFAWRPMTFLFVFAAFATIIVTLFVRTILAVVLILVTSLLVASFLLSVMSVSSLSVRPIFPLPIFTTFFFRFRTQLRLVNRLDRFLKELFWLTKFYIIAIFCRVVILVPILAYYDIIKALPSFLFGSINIF